MAVSCRWLKSRIAAIAMVVPALLLAQNQTPPNTPPEKADTEGTIVVSTDSPCTVTVDGEGGAALGASESRTFTVTAGSHVVAGTSTERSSLTQRKTVEVRPKERQSVALEFSQDMSAALRRDLAGGWAKNTNINNDPNRFCQFSFTVAEEAGGYTGSWDSSCTEVTFGRNLFVRTAYTVKTFLTATLRLTVEGSNLTGLSETSQARRVDIDTVGAEHDSGWQDGGAVQLSGTLLSPRALSVNVRSRDFAFSAGLDKY